MNTEMWLRVIRKTLGEIKNPVYDDYLRVARRLFPTQMRACAKSYFRAGAIKSLKGAMRHVANIDEEDPDAPNLQLGLIPGLAAPEFFNIGTMMAPDLIAFRDVTVDHFDAAIDLRKRVYSRQGARIEDLEQKRAWLLAHQKTPGESIGKVIERLQGIPRAAGHAAIDETHETA